jgi:hypothetical protein
MADITVTITIPDASVAEVSAATGASTRTQFQDWVRTQVKAEVKAYRVSQAHATEKAKVAVVEEAKRAALQAAEDSADVTLS